MNHFLLTQFPNIVLSFVLTYISIPPIIRVSKAKKLFDEPNHRKLNKVVVPTLGGIGIFIGLIVSFIIFQKKDSPTELNYLLGAVIMLFFIGLKDDILIISARKKLLVQLAAVAVLVFLGDIRIENMNNLFGLQNIPLWQGQLAAFFTILFLINAINLIDGIDGLAAGISLFISIIVGVWFYNEYLYSYSILSFALAGSLLAFLRFNLLSKKNKIFMGDTGSLIIGAVLSVIVIKLINTGAIGSTRTGIFQHFPTIALALLIVPVCDVLRVFTVRIYQKRSPFSADMNHIHHLLIRVGMNHIQASCFLVSYTLLFLLLSLIVQDYISVTASFLSILALSFFLVGTLVKINRIRAQRKKTQLKLIRKILTKGISTEDERLIEMIKLKKILFKRRA